MNLLEETIEFLNEFDIKPEDVEWVGTYKWYCSWEEFTQKANFEYHNGFGAQEIASDIMIVGKDWWLSRSEYDGSEGWDFNTYPEKPKNHGIKELVTDDYKYSIKNPNRISFY